MTLGPFNTNAFANADFPNQKARVTYNWNGNFGPSSSQIRLEREMFDGWDTLARESTDRNLVGTNSIEFEVAGKEYIKDGTDYRLYINQPDAFGAVLTYDVTVEFIAFDANCSQGSE